MFVSYFSCHSRKDHRASASLEPQPQTSPLERLGYFHDTPPSTQAKYHVGEKTIEKPKQARRKFTDTFF